MDLDNPSPTPTAAAGVLLGADGPGDPWPTQPWPTPPWPESVEDDKPSADLTGCPFITGATPSGWLKFCSADASRRGYCPEHYPRMYQQRRSAAVEGR